ncbi:RHS repeat domain-containing protein [Paraglaciecola sp.]|uniref:RHS repeat domain-containing protein n=1 Tax=Paraglaciecola sp. TaxID=1920173 RepID=UPI003EF6DC33
MNKDILKMIHIPQRIGKLKVNILSISGILSTLLFSAYAQANNTVTLTWDGISEADGYQLEEKLASDPNWDNAIKTQTDDDTATLTLTDRADGEYVYRVIGCVTLPTNELKCSDEIAEYSAPTPPVTLPLTQPGPVTLSYMDLSWNDDGLLLDWESTKPVVVELQRDQGIWFDSVQKGADESDFEYNTTVAGSYRYRIKTCDADFETNCSDWVESKSVSFQPAVPDNFKSYADASTVTASDVEITPSTYSVSQGVLNYNIPLEIPSFPSGLKADISSASIRGAFAYISHLTDRVNGLTYCNVSNRVKSMAEQEDADGLVPSDSQLVRRMCYKGQELVKAGDMTAIEADKADYESEYWAADSEYYLINQPAIKFVAQGTAQNTTVNHNIHSSVIMHLPNGTFNTYQTSVNIVTGDATPIYKLLSQEDVYGNTISYRYRNQGAINYQIDYSNGYKIIMSGLHGVTLPSEVGMDEVPANTMFLTIFAGLNPIKQYKFNFAETTNEDSVSGHFYANFRELESVEACGYAKDATDWAAAECATPLRFTWNSSKLLETAQGNGNSITAIYDPSRNRPVVGILRGGNASLAAQYNTTYNANIQNGATTAIAALPTANGHYYTAYVYENALYQRNDGTILEVPKDDIVVKEAGKTNNLLGYSNIEVRNYEQNSKTKLTYEYNENKEELLLSDSKEYAGQNKLVAHSTYVYETHIDNSNLTYLDTSTTLSYAAVSGAAQLLSKTEVDNDYDSYGNLTLQTKNVYASNGTTADVLAETTTHDTSDITNNEVDWLIGFVNTSLQTKQIYTGAVTGKIKTNKVTYSPKEGTTDIEVTTSYESNGTTVYRKVTTARNSSSYVTSTEIEATNAEGITEQRTTTYSDFNDYGSPRIITDAKENDSTLTYDNRFQAPTSVTNIDNFTQTTQYSAFGRVVNQVDHLNINTNTVRFTCTTGSGCPTTFSGNDYAEDNITSIPYSYSSAHASYGETQTVTHTNASGQNGVSTTIVYYNSQHQRVAVDTQALGGVMMRQVFLYDDKRRLARTSTPFKVGSSSFETNWTINTYDDYGRIEQVALPSNGGFNLLGDYSNNGGLINYDYSVVTQGGITLSRTQKTVGVNRNFWNAISRTRENQVSSSDYNALGQLVKATDAASTAIDYEYDAHGNLTKTRVAGDSNTDVVITYDNFANRLTMDDPSTGKIDFAYSGFGELKTQTWQPNTTKAKSMTYKYDELGRNTERVDKPASGTARTHLWQYDTQFYGLLDKVITASTNSSTGLFVEEYEYNDLGLVERYTAEEPANNWSKSFEYAYDSFGRQTMMTYPSGYQVAHAYHDSGHALSAHEMNTGTAYTPPWAGASDKALRIWQAGKLVVDSNNGQSSSMLYGNQVVTTQSQDRAGAIMTKTAGQYAGSGTIPSDIQSSRFYFDSAGGLNKRETTQTELAGVKHIRESFVYDNLNRVKKSTVYHKGNEATDSYVTKSTANYGYNALGNLTSRSDKGGTFAYALTNNASVYGVTSANGQAYKYDKYGNVIEKGDQTITYDVFNKPTNINGQQFAYAADHSRYKQTDSNGKVTYYLLGGVYEEITDGDKSTTNHYVDGVFLHQLTTENGMTTAKRHYFITDHLNSITGITDENANVVERLSFNTWGERRASDWSSGAFELDGTTTRGFTGHEMLDDTGFIHMNGRVYDPVAGRFLSADIYIQTPTFTQSYNRYSYVMNNPLSFVDPSGYTAETNEPVCGASQGCIVVTGSRQEQIRHELDVQNALADYYNRMDRGESTSGSPVDLVQYNYGGVTQFNFSGGIDLVFREKMKTLNRKVGKQTRNMLRKYKKGKFRFGKGEKITYAQAVWLWRYGGGRRAVVNGNNYSNNNIFTMTGLVSLVTASSDRFTPFGDATKVFGSENFINGKLDGVSTYDFDFKTSGIINLMIRNPLNQQAIYEHGAGQSFDIEFDYGY